MQITYNNQQVIFHPWKPAQGTVLSGAVAFDTETTLIDSTQPSLIPHYVLGAAWDGHGGVFVTREHLSDFLQAHADCEFIFHNAAFDLKVMANRLQQAGSAFDIYGLVDAYRVWDTWLLHKLLRLATKGDTANGKGEATLEHCAETYLDITLPKDTTDSHGNVVRTSYGQWLHKPPGEIERIYLEYLVQDVLVTFDLFHVLQDRLHDVTTDASNAFGYVSADWLEEQQERWGPQTHHIQLKSAIVLDAITRNGLSLDTERRDDLVGYLDETVTTQLLALRAFGYLPGTGSQKTVQELLGKLHQRRPDLNLPRTDTGLYSTGREALGPFRDDDDFIHAFLSYKETEKLRSTFLNKMTGSRIHPSFQPLVRTGRTSSFGAINAQNLPRDDRVRQCFTASRGQLLVAADYSAIEMVTLAQACLTQFGLDSKLAEAINNGIDPHRLLAATVTGKPPEEITKEERQQAKAINFGKPGGMGSVSLKQYARQTYGIDFSDDEIEELTNSYFETYPAVESFLRDYDPWGDAVARKLNLTVGEYEQQTGRDWSQYDNDRSQPEPMLGSMGLKVLKESEPATGSGRGYTAEEIDYFWSQVSNKRHLFPQEMHRDIQHRIPSAALSSQVRALLDKRGVFTLTGRLRANASYTARHNTVFQGLAADGAKLALWKLWRAGYKLVNFIHDEVLIELPENGELAAAAADIKRLMIEGMVQVVSDVQVKVESAVMKNWSKAADKHIDPAVVEQANNSPLLAGIGLTHPVDPESPATPPPLVAA